MLPSYLDILGRYTPYMAERRDHEILRIPSFCVYSYLQLEHNVKTRFHLLFIQKYVSSTLELLTKRIWIKEKGIKKLKLERDDSMLKSSIFICFKVKLQNVRARRDQRLPKFMDFEGGNTGLTSQTRTNTQP